MTSRRDFLKLSGAALAGAFLPAATWEELTLPDQFGRVLEDAARSYSRPTPHARALMSLSRDDVIRISNLTLGDPLGLNNPVWYYGADIGYIHSSFVQPVQFRLNQVLEELPPEGLLAEVTIPFTDAFRGPGKEYAFAFRLYYQTTHWVNETRQGPSGEVWYRILDDTQKRSYYARAAHLRILPADETAPISTHIPASEKALVVELKKQIVSAYEGDHPVFIAKVSSGALAGEQRSLTPLGRFSTFYKRPSRHMTSNNLA
ncbi:MAG: twin-arginine translocation signal domain-containing protein, partial [Anaerolineales bacterium]|nr:twin-arginine translocation signal domain-containing protein [Anaerolineales bacterium]